MLRIFLVFFSIITSSSERPNFLIILTDDQDMSSIYPLRKTQELVANVGATFLNSFTSSPICCPSRASILTGQYQHNHRTFNNSISGGCHSLFWQRFKEPLSFSTFLHAAGYRTFYAGKYLNQYGLSLEEKKLTPPGWDSWIGLIGNSKYYDYSLVINETVKHFKDDYFTSVIESYGLNFLQSVHESKQNFLMVLATSAAHSPFTPEPKYFGKYNGTRAPRTPNFNIPISEDKHWLLRLGESPLSSSIIDKIDSFYSRRLETLLSVDDMVEKFVSTLQSLHLLENTYIFFTSDNGYHLGQFSLPLDKRQPYEFDIRVPLFIRGPKINPKSLISSPVVNIDLAPSILDLAGLPVPNSMDGVSFVPLLFHQSESWNRSFLIEYQGEGNSRSTDKECAKLQDENLYGCHVELDCKCEDSRNNSYYCLRLMEAEESDVSYCEFRDSENFIELYDLKKDPYQLNNLRHVVSNGLLDKYSKIIQFLKQCVGPACNRESI